MKILFVDPITLPYDTRTPLNQPLGGTASAVAYLSAALVRSGHEVAVINGGTDPTETDGVQFLKLPCPTPVLNSFDIVVLVSKAMAGVMRDIGCTRPLVLWCHLAVDQEVVQPLHLAAERDLYAGFAMVSQWQATTYHASFGIDAARIQVLRNAVAPAFHALPMSNRWLEAGSPPVLGYSSTPFRGLDILLLAFAAIRARLPGATLRVFSSMGIYGPGKPDSFVALYDLARALPGVDYVGPLSQPHLAAAMAEVDIWAYPCTFPETSCIAAMEAMAAGTLLVTTSLGALPETTAGFAQLYEIGGDKRYPGMVATHFAAQVLEAAARASADTQQSLQALVRQVAFARAHYDWALRAAEWTAWIEELG
jgi:glycosyltransferase involved in cell wall biosynthesis